MDVVWFRRWRNRAWRLKILMQRQKDERENGILVLHTCCRCSDTVCRDGMARSWFVLVHRSFSLQEVDDLTRDAFMKRGS